VNYWIAQSELHQLHACREIIPRLEEEMKKGEPLHSVSTTQAMLKKIMQFA
jgi:hypothetical protein